MWPAGRTDGQTDRQTDMTKLFAVLRMRLKSTHVLNLKKKPLEIMC